MAERMQAYRVCIPVLARSPEDAVQRVGEHLGAKLTTDQVVVEHTWRTTELGSENDCMANSEIVTTRLPW